MPVNIRRNLAIQLIPFGGANPLKLRLSNPVPFVLGTAGVSAALIAQGGTPAYAYSIASGSLPTGLSLNGATGIISGTPSVAGTSTFTARVQDSALTTYIATFSIEIKHILQPVAASPRPVDAGTNTQTYNFAVSGATGTVTWTSTTLPSWATLSAGGLFSIDTMSGLVFSGATISPTITASDSGSGDSISFVAHVVVNQGLQTFSASAFSTNAPIGVTSLFDAAFAINPFGGQKPYRYSLAPLVYPAPPSWITINPTTGFLTIAPPTATAPQAISLDYKITDDLGVSTTLVVVVNIVNPNNVIQHQQNGVNAGAAGPATMNFIGANVSVVGGVATITVGVADFYGAASGTNTYTATTGSIAYTLGELYVIKFANANTGAATLNCDALGAKAIQLAGAALTGGEIQAGATYELAYDGTQFQIVGSKGITTAAFGSTPNSAGCSLTGGVFTMQPANASFPGGLLASDWVAFNKKATLVGSNTTIPAGNTLANTTASTKLTSQVTLPSSIATGSLIRVKAAGTFSTTGTPTLNFQVLSGAAQIIGIGNVTMPATVTNNRWTFECDIIVTSSTTIEAQGEARFQTSATAETVAYASNTGGFAGALTLTIPGSVIAMQVTWGTASPSNTMTLRQITAEVLQI